MTAITFHVSNGGNMTGIGEFMAQLDAAGIPMGLVSIGNYGPIGEGVALMKQSGLDHHFVYRVPDLDVPNYGIDPVTAALNHWAAVKAKLPPEFDKARVWVCPVNEIDKGRSDWLGNFAAVFAASAMGEGYKVTMFGWSSGEPEPEHWQTAGMRRYLELCAVNPTKAAVALHEYSYSVDDIKEGYPYKIGRFQALFDACDSMGLARPTVHITEWGWTHVEVPPPDVAMPDIAWAHGVYNPHPQVKMAAVWYLGEGFAGIANLAQRLIEPVTEFVLNAPGAPPPVDPPPVDPPPPVPPSDNNLLRNPSFEDGWWHPGGVMELQIPNEWDFDYYDESTPNPHDANPWAKFQRPEVRVLPKAYLPQDEWPLFIRDGDHTLKPFGDNKSIYFWLEQTLDLPAGTKRFTPWTFADLVKGYVGNTKVWADDPQGRDGLARVLVNGQQVGDWVSLVPGEWNAPAWDFTAAGSVTLRIEFMCPFPLDNAGLFCDGWTLQVVGVEPPPIEPPPPPPPPTPAPTYLHARLTAVANVRRDATTSKPAVVLAREGLELIKVGNVTGQPVSGNDQWVKAVAFISRSYVTDSGPGKVKTNRNVNLRVVPTVTANWPVVLLQTGVEFEYLGNVKDFHNAGQWAAVSLYIWKPLTIDVQPGIRFGKLTPGTLSVSYGGYFNAPRKYPFAPTKKQLHEGLDFPVAIGTAVFAGAAGVVDFVRTVDPGFGYGKTVRIKHSDRYTTWLGHLSRVDVSVGQQVTAGQQVALSGNSGGSSGPHLHWTLVDNPTGLDGYVIDNVTDPTLLLFPEIVLPGQQPPPQTEIDLVPYFAPANGQYGDIVILKNNWGEGDERQQLQQAGNNLYVTKNASFEQRVIRASTIDLVLDTSRGNGEMYTVSGPWVAKQMTVGQSFTRTETVQVKRKDNCQNVGNPYTSTSQIKLVAKHASLPIEGGATVQDVIELHWILNGIVEERYFYGRHRGLVQWKPKDSRRSWAVEIIPVGQQHNNIREVVSCL